MAKEQDFSQILYTAIEIDNSKKATSNVFESIKQGLNEAIEYEKGNLTNVEVDTICTHCHCNCKKEKVAWRELFEEVTKEHSYAKIQPPATIEDIALVEKTLKVSLPNELKEFLLEMNGDGDSFLSTSKIIELNKDVRESEGFNCFMPLDNLLFFAHNGCGDYYGYSISKDGTIRDNSFFMWCHETDSRIEKWASNLKEFITRFYTDEL